MRSSPRRTAPFHYPSEAIDPATARYTFKQRNKRGDDEPILFVVEPKGNLVQERPEFLQSPLLSKICKQQQQRFFLVLDVEPNEGGVRRFWAVWYFQE